MKRYSILFKKTGENVSTASDPIAEWADQVDLETEGSFCLSYDDDRLVSAKVYSVRTVELPDWLPVGEWIANVVAWKWAFGFGVNEGWDPRAARFVAYDLEGSPFKRFVFCKLFNTKTFRSAFRADLKRRAAEWISLPCEKRSFGSPFSPRQWDCLAGPYDAKEARRIDESLYRYGSLGVTVLA